MADSGETTEGVRVEVVQSEVEFELPESRHRMRASLAKPVDGEPRPGILVLHEIFGLNDDIRRITKRFAELGYVAMAPDLYDAGSSKPLCVARTVYSMVNGAGPSLAHLSAALRWLESQPEVIDDRCGVAGFCMGGSFALLLGLREPCLKVSAPFYGATPKQVEDLAGICPVVGSFGERDAIFAPQGKRLKRHLDQLQVPHDVKIYPDAGHSFMSHREPGVTELLGRRGPMKVNFSPEDSEDAWARMETFFASHL